MTILPSAVASPVAMKALQPGWSPADLFFSCGHQYQRISMNPFM